MTFLEKKIPPPVLLLIVALVMVLAAGGLHMPSWPLLVFAAVTWAAGMGIAAAAILEFRRANTTVDPHSPESATSLITAGIFGVTRNPIYTSFTLILLGLALFLAVPLTLLGPLVYVLYISRFQIEPEERALSAKFGAEFDAYKTRVRRWL